MTEKRVKLKKINNESLVGTGNISVASSSHTHDASDIDTGISANDLNLSDYIRESGASGNLNQNEFNLSLNVDIGHLWTDSNNLWDAISSIPSSSNDLSDSSDLIRISNTNGLIRNDGSIDTSTYLTSHQDISGKENTSNKVTSISSSSTDAQYPSAKLLYDKLETKANSSHTHTKSQITDFPTLSNVATSGSYSDLSNKPSYTATVTSSTTGAYKIGSINISGSSVDIYGKDTDTHQSLSGYLQTSDVKDNLTSTDTNKPLSANQGKELKTLIKSNATHTTTPNYILDDGWVIGFTYDYSGTDYQTSKIIVGDGTDNLSLTFNGNNLTITDDATGDMWTAQIPFQAPHTISLTVGSLANATESNGNVSYDITVTMDGYDNQFSAQYRLSQNETKEEYFRHYNCLREVTSGYNSSITNLSITPTPKFSLNTSDIADNLTTNDATKVLSAKQGKVLNDLIGSAITYINQ